ncbi:tRNA wybutosine-synthesizing protein 4 [Caerostris darwini]|uniref:tRNA wybutosine-synthesizing protein 4 n=1 Tax=Caerostris darwini TaxID=1538125 RepID=A0AAV4MFX9_9ARAC|nr:tRNA wybutosine-synthesizing protein 4 [Caerostris darwini]
MQVQGTNDSSIVSKFSAANKGYFHDDCLKMFVNEKSRKTRSPLINRGYYIRFKAMETVFDSWFVAVASSKSLIISLGAGFDSSYFRLKRSNKLPSGCTYIEVDFQEVMKKKLDCISKTEFMDELSSESEPAQKNKYIVATSKDYAMLGIDLQHIILLQNCLVDLNIDFNVPTLFLSECSLTYMKPNESDAVISWAQTKFPNSAFTVYEQIHGEDGFGTVMKTHFMTLNCPLRSLKEGADEDSQNARFNDLGWPKCSSISMLEFYMEFPKKEKERIKNLEMFDEFEMWHEKCRHYVLTWACQGSISIPKVFQKMDMSYKASYLESICYRTEMPSFLRFGHKVELVSSCFVMGTGGFGRIQNRHERLGNVSCYDIDHKSQVLLLPIENDHLEKRMFHTMTRLPNETLIVIGGRSSPAHIYNDVISVNVDYMLQQDPPIHKYSTEYKTSLPFPIFRHSACLVLHEGVEKIFIFGGCTGKDVTTKCYLLNTDTWNIMEPTPPYPEDKPCARFSHSAACAEMQRVYVTGGLSKEEEILDSVWMFDTETSVWNKLSIPGWLPRYAHTSLYYDNQIITVGGVTAHYAPSSVGIIYLNELVAREIDLNLRHPKEPFIFSNHCCYVYEDKLIVTGGGGNCFSFGTYFNKDNIVIKLPIKVKE